MENFREFLPLGFIGSGNMGCGIMQGLLHSKIIKPNDIYASNSRHSSLPLLKEKGIQINSNLDVAKNCKTVVLCVKPHLIETILNEIRDNNNIILIISVAAGVTIKQMENAMTFSNCGLIRVMPNTAVSIKEGCAAITKSSSTSSKHVEFCKVIFQSICKVCEEVSEPNINSMIGISGSGIAYMYVVAEALIDAGVKMGLPRKAATQLVSQTMVGAGKMIQETELHPMQLKDEVTSPGGTTICGVAKLEELGLRNALIKAAEEASYKAYKMSLN